MEILLWLLPAVLVTVAAMVWVSWLGREGRGEVDREVGLARMAAVLEGATRRRLRPRRRTAPRYAVRAPVRDRSTGVAVRPSRQAPPAPSAPSAPSSAPDNPVRRAS